MSYYPDLTTCLELGTHLAETLRAVGWLSKDALYPRESISFEVFERLLQFVNDPWQPAVAGGSHGCDLCRFRPEAFGKANLWIPNGDCIFIAPELIVHYINAHEYQPPDVFCDAVLNCPDMRSREYKRLLLDSGWRSARSDGEGNT